MLLNLVTLLQGVIRPRERDRGDVPGWVLITLMTVGIVMALWLVAEPTLTGLIKSALSSTGDPNS